MSEERVWVKEGPPKIDPILIRQKDTFYFNPEAFQKTSPIVLRRRPPLTASTMTELAETLLPRQFDAHPGHVQVEFPLLLARSLDEAPLLRTPERTLIYSVLDRSNVSICGRDDEGFYEGRYATRHLELDIEGEERKILLVEFTTGFKRRGKKSSFSRAPEGILYLASTVCERDYLNDRWSSFVSRGMPHRLLKKSSLFGSAPRIGLAKPWQHEGIYLIDARSDKGKKLLKRAA